MLFGFKSVIYDRILENFYVCTCLELFNDTKLPAWVYSFFTSNWPAFKKFLLNFSVLLAIFRSGRVSLFVWIGPFTEETVQWRRVLLFVWNTAYMISREVQISVISWHRPYQDKNCLTPLKFSTNPVKIFQGQGDIHSSSCILSRSYLITTRYEV